MAVHKATVTINAAFLQEIKEVNSELWQDLAHVRRAASALFSTRAQCLEFADLLARLRDLLALHFALEEAYGYFDDPVYVAPRLSERARGLRSQHQVLYLEVNRLVDLAEDLCSRGRVKTFKAVVAAGFEAFHRQLQAHEADEEELILQAYGDDLGVGD
jgi:hypothetical protein